MTFGPFVDDETCAFPFNSDGGADAQDDLVTTDGDIKRHTELIVTVVRERPDGRAAGTPFNVFIDADSPTRVGDHRASSRRRSCTAGRSGSQSGRLVYDFETDELTDPHPGPLGEAPDVCELLAP